MLPEEEEAKGEDIMSTPLPFAGVVLLNVREPAKTLSTARDDLFSAPRAVDTFAQLPHVSLLQLHMTAANVGSAPQAVRLREAHWNAEKAALCDAVRMGLQHAQEREWDSVWLLSHDTPLSVNDVTNVLRGRMMQVPADWECLYLSGAHASEWTELPEHSDVVQIRGGTFAVPHLNVAVRKTLYTTLIERLRQRSEPLDMTLIDLAQRDKCYALVPSLLAPESMTGLSRDDLAKEFVHCTYLFD
jgi:hypothetical protein